MTGCDRNYDGQRIIEGIYDKTRPSLFTEIEDFEGEDFLNEREEKEGHKLVVV